MHVCRVLYLLWTYLCFTLQCKQTFQKLKDVTDLEERVNFSKMTKVMHASMSDVFYMCQSHVLR